MAKEIVVYLHIRDIMYTTSSLAFSVPLPFIIISIDEHVPKHKSTTKNNYL